MKFFYKQVEIRKRNRHSVHKRFIRECKHQNEGEISVCKKETLINTSECFG
jgi:hypothetical protein